MDLHVNWAVFVAVVFALGIAWPPVTATLGTLTSEIFSTRVRYTGITLGYQIGAALAGGTAPMLATYLLDRSGGSWTPIAVYLMVLAAISLAAVLYAPRLAQVDEATENTRSSK